MAPITHALLGGSVATAFRISRLGKWAWIIAASSAMVPDVDIFFYTSDPLTHIILHRHFTHALIFIPLGALLVTLLFMLKPQLRPRLGQVYLAAFIGYATHGLLDSATSYGTLLFWPFSYQRVALDCIAIVDPIFTGALLIGLIAAVRRQSPPMAIAAVLFCLGYLALGGIQESRALRTQHALADQRGQIIEHGRVIPTLGNLLVWRSIYQSAGQLHADGIREGFGNSEVQPGPTAPMATVADLPVKNQFAMDEFKRFRWFSDGFIASTPAAPSVIGDMRYSARTSAFDPVWGVHFEGDQPQWITSYGINRRASVARALWSDLRGKDFTPFDVPPHD